MHRKVGGKAISIRWVYGWKPNQSGGAVWTKVRVVAKGYIQSDMRRQLQYFETFLPTEPLQRQRLVLWL